MRSADHLPQEIIKGFVMGAMASPELGATPRVLGKPAFGPKTLRGCQVMMAELVDVGKRMLMLPW